MGEVTQVIKRDGRIEPYDISKIKEIIKFATNELNVNGLKLESKVNSKIKSKVKTQEIQFNLIDSAITLITIDEPDWSIVAGRLEMYNLRREIWKFHSISYDTPLYEFIEKAIKLNLYDKSILSHYTKDEIDEINKFINPEYDLFYPISSTKSLLKKYLINSNKKPFELPQFANIVTIMFLNQFETNNRLKQIKQEYEAVASCKISLATPFKANLRKPKANLSSCFITEIDDNIESINHTFKSISEISKNGGGVGVYLGRLRPSNSLIKGQVGGNNITIWTKIIDDLAPAWNQCGIRKGAITVALDIFHKDILSFIEMKTESGGDVREKCFNIFPQVVINDKFIHAVKNNLEYPLLDRTSVLNNFNIDICNLKEFNDFYDKIFESVKKSKLYNCELINAKNLWKRILEIYVETGDLYVVNKDSINKTNPFKNSGRFTNSGNLCLSGDTLLYIKDKDGIKSSIPLAELENYSNYEVVSRNLETNTDEWKHGYDFIKSEHDEYYEITDEKSGKIIKCSGEHKIFTKNRGYVKAKDLVETDELYIMC